MKHFILIFGLFVAPFLPFYPIFLFLWYYPFYISPSHFRPLPCSTNLIMSLKSVSKFTITLASQKLQFLSNSATCGNDGIRLSLRPDTFAIFVTITLALDPPRSSSDWSVPFELSYSLPRSVRSPLWPIASPNTHVLLLPSHLHHNVSPRRNNFRKVVLYSLS